MKQNVSIFLVFILLFSLVEPALQGKVYAEDDQTEVILANESAELSSFNGNRPQRTKGMTVVQVGYQDWGSNVTSVNELAIRFPLNQIDRERHIESITMQIGMTELPVGDHLFLNLWGANQYGWENGPFVPPKSVTLVNERQITESTETNLSFDVTDFVKSQLNHQTATLIFGGPRDSGVPDDPNKPRIISLYTNNNEEAKRPRLIVKYKEDMPPTGKLSIAGNGYTNDTKVQLQIESDAPSSDGIAMRLSNTKDDWMSSWEPFSPTKEWKLAEGDGSKTVFLQFRNQRGVESDVYEAMTILDRTAPTGTVKINQGAKYANSRFNARLYVSANDGDGIGNIQVQFSNDKNTWSDWQGFKPDAPYIWSLTVGEGEKIVYMRLRDGLGNESNPIESNPIIVDTQPPVVTGVENGGVYNHDLTIKFNEGEARLNGYHFSSGGTVTAEGAHTLTVTDAAGNVTTVRFTIDKTPPTGSLRINKGNGFTNNPAVQLHVEGKDDHGIAKMRFSNKPNDWSLSEWVPFSPTYDWTINADHDGNKEVYMQLMDKAGNVSTEMISANIHLDRIVPTGSIQINEGKYVTNVSDVKLTVDGSDNDEVAAMQFSNNQDEWTEDWIPFSSTYDWTLPNPETEGEKTVYLRLKDRAGNISSPYSAKIYLDLAPLAEGVADGGLYNKDVTVALAARVQTAQINGKEVFKREAGVHTRQKHTITEEGKIKLEVSDIDGGTAAFEFMIDRQAPTGSIKFNGNAIYTNSRDVLLLVTGDDHEGSGHVQMRFSNDVNKWQDDWVDFDDTKPWSLSEAGGSEKTVYMQLRDLAKNVSEYQASIIYKSVPVARDSIAYGWKDQNLEFKKEDFLFTNEDKTDIEAIRIVTLPDKGELFLNGKKVSSGQIVSFSQLDQLVFTPAASWSGITDFTWEATNGYEYSPYTGTLKLEVDMQPEKPTIKTNQTSEWTNKTVEVMIEDGKTGPSGIDSTEFRIGEDSDWQFYEGPFTISEEGEHRVFAITKDRKGEESDIAYATVKIDRTQPSAPKIKLSKTGWTNASVEVEITDGKTGPSGVSKTEYKVGPTGAWKTYKDAFTLTESGEHTVYARTVDQAGNIGEASESVVRIDQMQPGAPKITLSKTGWTNTPVEVEITNGKTGPSGVAKTEYKVGSTGAWKTYKDAFTLTESGEHTVYARTVDQAGNIGETSESIVKIDRTQPSAPKIELSKTGWTNTPVEVEITDGKPGPSGVSKTEYKIGSTGTWKTYKDVFTLTESGEHTVYARTVDQAGNIGETSEAVVRIDQIQPGAPKIKLSKTGWTNTPVEVEITNGKTGPSGVSKTEYKVGSTGTWKTYKDAFTLTESGEHTVYARTVDQAGNIGE
ncbi:hypothetical protein D5F11_012070, partial [Siminovitchia terrae]